MPHKLRRSVSVLLIASLALLFVPVTSAADPIAPYPPSWISQEDYLLFPSSDVYEPDSWSRLEGVRAMCDEGRYDDAVREASSTPLAGKDPGFVYEYSLIYYKAFLSGMNVSSRIRS
jgi:hypothetical protein